MSLAQALLWAAASAGTLAVAFAAQRLWRPTERVARNVRFALSAAAFLVAVAFAFLLTRFIGADVSYQYVFLYTKQGLALPWRIAGTWAGREGSLLLWAGWLAAVAWAVSSRHRRPAMDDAEALGRDWTMLFLSLFSAALLWAVALQDTFARTPDFFLAGRPEGNGLNPTLKSQFILIHPPLMFLAYALATVPAAAALGHLASGTDRWSRIAMPWARLDWLLYTVAIGLGGLWAYYTLGFGGYWAWDPVEVANLLPWIALTLYLHAQLHHDRHGSYKVAGPFLALLPLLLTLFSTISTRSGLWVSVHAFTDPTNTFDPDAPGRFLDILGVEPSLLVPVRLFLATLAFGLALWALRLAKDLGTLRVFSRAVAAVLAAYGAYVVVAPASALSLLFEAANRVAGGRTGIGLLALGFAACLAAAAPALFASGADAKPRPGGARITLQTLAYFSVLVLGLGLLVLFLFHAAAVNGWDTAFYERRLPFLAAPALAGLIVMLGHGILGRRRSVLVAAAALGAAGLAAAVWTSHREGAFLLVLSLVATVVGLEKVRRAALPPGVGKRQWLAPTLLWAAALLDVLFWLNPPTRIGVGSVSWHPVWPAQAIFGGIALYVLWQAHRVLAGAAPARPGHVHLLAGLLAGFWVAAPLALAAWLLHRRDGLAPAPLDAKARARLRQAALYGAHLAVCVALLGYATSTYWKESEVHDLAPGDAATVAGHTLTLERIDVVAEPGTAFAGRFDAVLAQGERAVAAEFGWEEQVGAHFPLPATLRRWDGDVYANVRSIEVADSACGPARTIEAYQASAPPRACADGAVASVQVEVAWLPGLGLVWLALALFAFHMALLMAMQPPSSAPDRPAAAP